MCARLRKRIYIYISISKKTYYILTYIYMYTYICAQVFCMYKCGIWVQVYIMNILTSPQSKGFPPARPLRRFCSPSWETRRNISQLWGPRYLDLEGESWVGTEQICVYDYDECISGWWFGTFFIFHILGIIIPTDFHIFQRGWNHQPDMIIAVLSFYSFWKIHNQQLTIIYS